MNQLKDYSSCSQVVKPCVFAASLHRQELFGITLLQNKHNRPLSGWDQAVSERLLTLCSGPQGGNECEGLRVLLLPSPNLAGDPHSHTPPPGSHYPRHKSLIPAFVFPDESQKNGGEGRKGKAGVGVMVLFVFPLIGNTLGLGRGLGPGSRGRPGVLFLRGSLLWSFLSSPQKSRLLGGPRGAAGSPLRSVPLRDDPELPLSGGNLSPLLTDPLPSLQGYLLKV
ncbi:hypothetical protein NQZ68_037198 [Dissostichus eleginoides]|nr:hypothetical protein NQZ68_037198 [Dissostichus eleginoides]